MEAATVRIESGLLAGAWDADHKVCSFKGIPYARAPIGPLRWRPPEPMPGWDGIRPADSFGPRCVQPNRPPHAVGYFGPEPQSEDCLTLNVWTSRPSRDQCKAVMVWFHGGGFLVGSASLPIFSGAGLASRDVVLVTVNYRLGRLGFLAHPALSAEQPYRASGNYGHLDQIAALQWVRKNIAAFGGNPDCVTVFGQSAGASSVCILSASPLARGLFHRAIGQSGGAFFAQALPTLDHAERSGVKFAAALECRSADDLRAQPAGTIQFHDRGGPAADIYDSNAAGSIDRATAWPVIDGHLLPACVRAVFEDGNQADVPLLTGSTADEGSTQPSASSLAAYLHDTELEYGSDGDRFLALFPAASDQEAIDSSRRALGSRLFNWENRTWAEAHRRTASCEVYLYHFGQAPPKPRQGERGDLSRDIGAFHTAEIPYVFRTLDARPWRWTAKDYELSDIVSRYWTNFARTGNPNGAGLDCWPAFDPARPSTLHLGHCSCVGEAPFKDVLDFWTATDRQRRARSRS